MDFHLAFSISELEFPKRNDISKVQCKGKIAAPIKGNVA